MPCLSNSFSEASTRGAKDFRFLPFLVIGKSFWCAKVTSHATFCFVYVNKFFHCWEFFKYRKRNESFSAMETLEENFVLQILPYSNIWIEILCSGYSGNTVLISVGVMQDCKLSWTKVNLFLEMTCSKLLSGMWGITLLWLQLMFQVKIIVYTKVWWRAEIKLQTGCDRKMQREKLWRQINDVQHVYSIVIFNSLVIL